MSTYQVSTGSRSVYVNAYDEDSARAIGTAFLLLETPTIVGARPMSSPINVTVATYDQVQTARVFGKAKILDVEALDILSKHVRKPAEIDAGASVFHSLMFED